MTKKNVLIKNSLFGVLQFVAVAVLTFLCVPIFINRLGAEAYGVFALVTILGNLNFFSSFGLNSALLVFLSKQGKTEESRRDIIVVLISTIVIAYLLCSILYIYKAPIIESIFSIPEKYIESSSKLYDYLLAANFLLIIGQVAVSIIDSLQKIYISNVIQFVYNLIYWIGLIIVVLTGGGLESVGIPLFVAAFVWSLLITWKAVSLWGSFKLTQPLRPHFKRVFVKQFSYGFEIFTAGFCGFFLEPLSKILLSNFCGINLVAYYDIALRIKHQLSGVFQKAAYPLFPYISEQPKSPELNEKVIDMCKKIQLLVAFLSLIIIFTFPIMVKLWLGDDYNHTTLIYIVVLAVSYLMFSPPILPMYYYLQSKSMADRTIYMHLGGVVSNVLVFFALYKFAGAYSIVISNTASVLFAYLLGQYYMRKYVDMRISKQFTSYAIMTLWIAVTLLMCGLTKYYLLPTNLYDIIVYPLIIIATFIIFARFGFLVSKVDIDRYLGAMPKIRDIAKKILFKKEDYLYRKEY